MTPGLNLKVDNTLSDDGSQMAVNLAFNAIEDFEPARIAAQVPALRALLETLLELDRVTLKKAAALMQAYAGKGYRIDLLPLFPIGREIRYWILRR